MSLDFYQIYYNDEQLSELYPIAVPYKNNKLTPHFENSVISDLVPTLKADYISVCSWRLKKKRGDGWTQVILNSEPSITKEKIFQNDFDVAVLTPRSHRHKPLAMALQWHGEAWDSAFKVFKSFLSSHLNIKLHDELTHSIYENHFIAKREIYHDYVKFYLRPAINFIESEPVFRLPSGYIKRKKAQSEIDHITPILKGWGLSDYPIGVFILERLFSIFIEGRNYKVVNV